METNNFEKVLLGKMLTESALVLRPALGAINAGIVEIADEDNVTILSAISGLMEERKHCDVLNVIEKLHNMGCEDSVRMVRDILDAQKDVDVAVVMESIVKQPLGDWEHLKTLLDEVKTEAAGFIVSKDVKEIKKGTMGDVSYIVRIKGGTTVLFRESGNHTIQIQCGNIHHFPVSFNFVEGLYNELNGEKQDGEPKCDEQEDNKEQNNEPSVPTKSKSYFEKFLK